MTDLWLACCVIKMRETRLSGSANLLKGVNVIDIHTLSCLEIFAGPSYRRSINVPREPKVWFKIIIRRFGKPRVWEIGIRPYMYFQFWQWPKLHASLHACSSLLDACKNFLHACKDFLHACKEYRIHACMHANRTACIQHSWLPLVITIWLINCYMMNAVSVVNFISFL